MATSPKLGAALLNEQPPDENQKPTNTISDTDASNKCITSNQPGSPIGTSEEENSQPKTSQHQVNPDGTLEHGNDNPNESTISNQIGNQEQIIKEIYPPLNSSELQVNPDAATESGNNENEEAETEEHPQILEDEILTMPREYSLLTVTLTALVQLATIIVLIVMIPLEIWVRRPGTLSNTAHSLYVTGVTIMATLIAKFTTGTLKTVWVVKSGYADQRNVASKNRQQRIEVLLGLGSFHDQLLQFTVSVSFILSGLITAALVAGLTLSSATTSIPATAYIYMADLTGPWSDTSGCLSLGDNVTQGWTGWPLANGSILSINPPACSDQADISAAFSDYNVNLHDPNPLQLTAYQLNGVAVTSSAVGAPWRSSGFGMVFGVSNIDNNIQFSDESAVFESASQCFPTLSLNPVQCRRAGNIVIGQNSLHVVTSNCNISTPIYAVDPRVQGATSAGVCSDLSKFGKGTILLGSTNSQATNLAGAMWDIDFSPPPNSSFSYAVACEVDITPHIATRTMTYDKFSVSASSFNLCSEENEEPMITTATSDTTLLYGMAGLYPILVENTYRDGSLDTLWSQINRITGGGETGINSTGTLVFENSKTPLEDALGIAIGIALSLRWGGDNDFVSPFRLGTATYGEVSAMGVRVGNGRWESVLFIIPSLYSLALLTYLYWHVRNMHN